MRIFITGMGLISPVGKGTAQTERAIRQGLSGIGLLDLFSSAGVEPLPVGEVDLPTPAEGVPRTHQLALLAAREALQGPGRSPDAIVLGVTTGGILTTEENLKSGCKDPTAYRYHSVGSVAAYLAAELNCTGLLITVSTACSSGTVALKVAESLLRTERAGCVLAGGADSLCRLTYFGFNALQLIDPAGARPLDLNRNGMSISEGAAMFRVESHRTAPEGALAEICGFGLSCDAYHPAAPHPDGRGGAAAMAAAMKAAGITSDQIDYINLHGTGTIHNDLSEATAIHALFGDRKPPLSSVKGAFGHSLAAAGAIEAAVCTLSLQKKLIPANAGCQTPDPALKLDPVRRVVEADLKTVLSNSFGFGGNNAAVVVGHPSASFPVRQPTAYAPLAVTGSACFTGAGDLSQTLQALSQGAECRGTLPTAEVSRGLSPNAVRRLQRLPRMALSLAAGAHAYTKLAEVPAAVVFATGWGPLSETASILDHVTNSCEELTSPTSFVGSVHNSPAGQIAIHFQATGPNIAVAGDDSAFEQAVITAQLLAADMSEKQTLLVVGADEYHETLSPLFDASVALDERRSDGGGAFCVRKNDRDADVTINAVFYRQARQDRDVLTVLLEAVGGRRRLHRCFGVILAGVPLAQHRQGQQQLTEIESLAEGIPVVPYRKWVGEHASASAVAAVLATEFVRSGKLPSDFCGGRPEKLEGKGALVLGLGHTVTAMEILPGQALFAGRDEATRPLNLRT
jgi:3-oxoacyl-[acyl-carrier-protein] synthase-1/3-oxoacyl-[acyl-carrier-protein] synthase II